MFRQCSRVDEDIFMGALKTIAFVDGENLVWRYQAMLTEGRKPKAGVVHIPDVFVWIDTVFNWSIFDLRRVAYYSSMVGDATRLQETEKQIANTQYSYSHEMDEQMPKANFQVVPHLFKKDKQSRKTRMVDIQIIIDVMRHTFSQSYDVIYLFSGDGDYLPLIEEVMRQGKQVYISAFSSGLNEKLISRVDMFTPLDEDFFEA